MQRMDKSTIADRLIARVGSTTAASITSFELVTPTLAKVVASFSSVDKGRNELLSAVAKATDHRAAPVEGSFRTVSSYGNPAMVGFVKLNRETRPYEESAASKMVALASNMLMDETDDSLWDVRTDGNGGKMLCRQQSDALQQLMETARIRDSRAPKMTSILSSADTGNFVSYVDPDSEELRYGYVVATSLEIAPVPVGGTDIDSVTPIDGIEVLPMDSMAPDNTSDEAVGEGNRIAERMEEDLTSVVPASVVVASVYLNGDDRHAEVAAPSNVMNKQSLIDYYQRLYAKQGPKFYAELVNIINNHSGF